MAHHLSIIVLPDTFVLCRFSPDTPLPKSIENEHFVSVVRDDRQLSVICSERFESLFPNPLNREAGWKCLGVVDVVDPPAVGVLDSIIGPLAKEL